QIIEGQYKSEDKFPSKRALGQHLSVSNTTIEHAYQLLLDEGYIYSKPRSGYFVSDIETLPIIPTNINHAHQIFSSNENYHNPKPGYDLAFNMSVIDNEYFPLSQFSEYAKVAFEDDDLVLLLLAFFKCEISLCQEIAHYLFKCRCVICYPEQITIGSS